MAKGKENLTFLSALAHRGAQKELRKLDTKPARSEVVHGSSQGQRWHSEKS